MTDYSALMRSDILECATPFIVTVLLETAFVVACIFLFRRMSKLGKATCIVLMLFPAIILTVNIVNNLPELTRMIGDYARGDYRECTGAVASVEEIKNSDYCSVAIGGREYCCLADSSEWFHDRANAECRIVYGEKSAYIIFKEVTKNK